MIEETERPDDQDAAPEEPTTPDEVGRSSEPVEPAAQAPPADDSGVTDEPVSEEPISTESLGDAEPPADAGPSPDAEPLGDAEPPADAEPSPDAEPLGDAEPPAGAEPSPDAEPPADAAPADVATPAEESPVQAETSPPDQAPEPAAAQTPEQAAAGLTPAEAQAVTDEMVEASDETTAATDEADEPATDEITAATDDADETATDETTAAEPDYIEDAPREKPAIPGADLEVDIVPEGSDPLAREGIEDPEDVEVPVEAPPVTEDEIAVEPDAETTRAQAVIDLGADARYRATGKRKTAVARVILRPGSGSYTINGRPLDEHFPRPALQRNIRQPLETVGYDGRMDVVAKLHGGGVSSQAGALRHGISRALIEADPNLRGELKHRGFLTRDPRVKERKKAGLKKARKRPQFSKR